jgi:hypothetical protein
MADKQDPAVTWEWIKFQQKVSSLKYSKDLARIRRDDLKEAEQRYALALATHIVRTSLRLEQSCKSLLNGRMR